MLPLANGKTETSFHAPMHVRILKCTDIISICCNFNTFRLHLMLYPVKTIRVVKKLRKHLR